MCVDKRTIKDWEIGLYALDPPRFRELSRKKGCVLYEATAPTDPFKVWVLY